MLQKLELATVVGIKHIKTAYKRCLDEDFTLFYIVFPAKGVLGQEYAVIDMLSSEADPDIKVGSLVVMCSNNEFGRTDSIKLFNINDYIK